MSKTEKNSIQTSQDNLKYAIGASAMSIAGFALAAEEANGGSQETDDPPQSPQDSTSTNVHTEHTQDVQTLNTPAQQVDETASMLVENATIAEEVIVTIDDSSGEEVIEVNAQDGSIVPEQQVLLEDLSNEIEVVSIEAVSAQDDMYAELQVNPDLFDNIPSVSDSDLLIADQYIDNPTGELLDGFDLINTEII